MKNRYHGARAEESAPRTHLLGSFALFVSVLMIVLGGFAVLSRLGMIHAELPDPGVLAREALQEAADLLPREALSDLTGEDLPPESLPVEPVPVSEELPADCPAEADAEPETQPEPEPQLLAPAVELQWQEPELPNGCEATSLAMALTAAGYPADKRDLAFGVLPREDFWYDAAGSRHGPDPSEAYAGDPSSASGGWYCLEGPVAQAADSWIALAGGNAAAEIVTGLDRQQLEAFLQDGVPVVAWVTRDYGPTQYADRFCWILPDGSEYLPYDNLHCVLAAALEPDGSYLVADPLEGWQTVDAGTFWEGFRSLGCRAVVIR